jgi:hypothetical protein
MPADADPLRDVVFILRTGALFPIYRTFSLLEQLKGQIARADHPLLPRLPRWRRRAAFHGRARRRAQLPPEDLLRAPHDDPHAIKTLFANDIDRRIEEVIKVDQTDEEILRDEIDEYVVTDAIRAALHRCLRRLSRDAEQAHDGIAVWVSGFFGSGKSSFAKMLGLAIANRPIVGEPAADRFAERAGDKKLQVLLKATINEQIPTHAVIFDVSTDRGIRSGNQTLTEIMYGLFLQSLGYAKDLDLSELEIGLEEKGRSPRSRMSTRASSRRTGPREGQGRLRAVRGEPRDPRLEPDTYPMADSWVKAVKNKATSPRASSPSAPPS